MKEKNLYECHVFVCTQNKEGKECCAAKGASKIKDELKSWAREKYGKRVRVNNSGCLGQCENGIATVLYPRGEWQLKLKDSNADIELLKKRIQRNIEKLQEND